MKTKTELRNEIKEKIKRLDLAYCESASELICSRVMALEEYKKAKNVFCFVGTKGEPDTRTIIKDALESGKRVGTPLCVADGIMEVYEIHGFDDLRPGVFGILEPKPGLKLMEPDEIEFAVLPCVTCDHNGNRLGHGKGYYDRYLKRADFPTCMVCLEKLTSSEIPMNRFDKKADRVITDAE